MSTSASSQSGQFNSTRWSLIAEAQAGSERGRCALQELCELYWFPVYAYCRRRGFQAEDARDLTQDLFVGILRRDGFAAAIPEKGRFRSYLLAAAKNLIAEQARNRRTLKRGGAVKTWSIDWATAEERLRWEPHDTLTPERVFEMKWAKQILADTLAQLDALNSEPARREYYLRLRGYIAVDSHSIPYGEAARELQVTEAALRVQVHRLRKKFRELLRRNVADTLDDSSQIDEELQYLRQCLRSD